MSRPPIGVALYHRRGHQIHEQLVDHPDARVVAVCGFSEAELPEALRGDPALARCADLDAILADPRVELVSLCSPVRGQQAAQAIRCLEAGRHVYAEKPAALCEADLDAVLAAARRADRCFLEMADTVLVEPWWSLRRIVSSGRIGTVMSLQITKSYPMGNDRPQDETVDGGLVLQVGVHAARFAEHLTGARITDTIVLDTQVGTPGAGGLRTTAGLLFRLDTGAVATATLGYTNPPGIGRWGDDGVRIWGSLGLAEALDGGTRTRLIIGATDHGPILPDPADPPMRLHDALFAHLRRGTALPLDLDVLHAPLRALLRRVPSIR